MVRTWISPSVRSLHYWQALGYFGKKWKTSSMKVCDRRQKIERQTTYRRVQTVEFLPGITLSWTVLTLSLYKDVAQSHALWSLTTDTHRFPPKNVSPLSCANHEMLCCGNGRKAQEIARVSLVSGKHIAAYPSIFIAEWVVSVLF